MWSLRQVPSNIASPSSNIYKCITSAACRKMALADAANTALLPSCRLRCQAGRCRYCRALIKLPPLPPS